MPLITTPESGVAVLIPWQPDAPMRESLEFYSNIVPCRSGREVPTRLRQAPRQSFVHTFPIPRGDNALVQNLAHGSLKRRFIIGQWGEAQYVGSVSALATSIACETDFRDFRDESLAILWQSSRKVALVRIDTVGSGVLNLATTVGTAFTSAVLLPARYGVLVGGQFRRLTDGSRMVLEGTFRVQDNTFLEGDEPDQYLDEDIYYDETLLSGISAITEEFRTPVVSIDYKIGRSREFAPEDYNRIARPHRQLAGDGAESVWALRLWLHRRCGQVRPFWLPTFENDMRLSMTGTLGTTLTIKSDDYNDFSARNHIAILDRDGNWYPREVVDTTPGTPTMTVELSSAVAVDAANVARISFLGRKRLSSDRIDLQWPGGGVCEIQPSITELEPE